MIIYATATNTSVGQLFMAGIGAGLIFGLLGLIYIYIYARKRNLRSSNKFSGTELWEAFKGAGWSLLVPVIILGGIYTGKFTPTEAASVSVVYALFVGMFIYKEIDLPKLYTLCVNSAITTAQVLILVAAASVFGWGLTISGVPQMLASFISEHFNNVWLFLLFLNLMLLVIGMFMDGTTAIVIVAPLIYPAAVSFGIDPVHLGIIMVANLAIGMYTPPFGLNIFVTNSITGLQMHDMIQGLLKFILVSIIALLLISYVPEISMFIPNLVYK